MTFMHGVRTRIMYAGTDISAFFKSQSVDQSIDTEDVTCFQPGSATPAKSYFVGLGDAEVSLEGFYDPNSTPSTGLDYLLNSLLYQDSQLVVGYNADTIGSTAYGVQGQLTKYSIKTPKDGMATANANFVSDTGREFGYIVHNPITAETTTGNAGAGSIDNTVASTANGGVLYWQVLARSGTTPSLTLTLTDSADNSTFADIVPATSGALNAVGSGRVAFSGTVRRYTRLRWAISGSSPSFTFAAVFVRK